MARRYTRWLGIRLGIWCAGMQLRWWSAFELWVRLRHTGELRLWLRFAGWFWLWLRWAFMLREWLWRTVWIWV